MLNYYKKVLTENKSNYLESFSAGKLDLSQQSISLKLESIANEVVKQLSDGLLQEPEAKYILDTISNNGEKALLSLRETAKSPLLPENALSSTLEAIVKFDGSRPSFIIKNGEVDLSNSVVNSWFEKLYVSRDLLNQTIPSVGKIIAKKESNIGLGTGFLISEKILVTNRHVLQDIAFRNDEKASWEFFDDVYVDFRQELNFENSDTVRFSRVIFAGASVVDKKINHAVNDIAILELEHHPKAFIKPFSLRDLSTASGDEIYTIGYPGFPDIRDYPLDVLGKLFEKGFGIKRLAPGMVMDRPIGFPGWSFLHDATTLGGNSGSVIVRIGKEDVAAGLHYGGSYIAPRRNYAHSILLLEEKDNYTNMSLRDTLKNYKIDI